MFKSKIIQAVNKNQIDEAKKLFLEYAKSLDFELCFQDFDKELAELPGSYAPPDGRLYIAKYYNKTAGCIALRKFKDGVCEMKRLYVRPQFRGHNIGKKLVELLIEEARKIGYMKMVLDTVPSMQTAQKLYKSFGFHEIKPYRINPIKGAVFMELVL
jgi:ribosomal protein S18 acetylase RimI-like enzyme